MCTERRKYEFKRTLMSPQFERVFLLLIGLPTAVYVGYLVGHALVA